MDQRAVIAKKEVMIKENKLQISLLQNEIQLSQRRQDTVINKQFGTSPLKIETMSFSSRTYNALMAEGITTCSALLAYTSFNDLSRIRNIGTTTLLDIANKMYSYGFCDWVNKTLVNTTGKLREIIQRGLDNRNGMF